MKAYSVLEMHSQRLIAVGLVAVLLLAFVVFLFRQHPQYLGITKISAISH